MSTGVSPVVGNWYRHLDKGLFCVLAFDEDAGVIELQQFDGNIEEVELTPWYGMTLETAEAPEDWTGPVDSVESDDLPYTEPDTTAKDWRSSLQKLAGPAQEPWEDSTPEDERDDRCEHLLADREWPREDSEERIAPDQESFDGSASSR